MLSKTELEKMIAEQFGPFAKSDFFTFLQNQNQNIRMTYSQYDNDDAFRDISLTEIRNTIYNSLKDALTFNWIEDDHLNKQQFNAFLKRALQRCSSYLQKLQAISVTGVEEYVTNSMQEQWTKWIANPPAARRPPPPPIKPASTETEHYQASMREQILKEQHEQQLAWDNRHAQPPEITDETRYEATALLWHLRQTAIQNNFKQDFDNFLNNPMDEKNYNQLKQKIVYNNGTAYTTAMDCYKMVAIAADKEKNAMHVSLAQQQQARMQARANSETNADVYGKTLLVRATEAIDKYRPPVPVRPALVQPSANTTSQPYQDENRPLPTNPGSRPK